MKLSSYVEELDDGDIKIHGWRILGVIMAVVVLLGALQFAVWGLGIMTAPWAGRQNVHRAINAPNNIIFQNDHFYQLNADIAADEANLKTEEAQAKAHAKAYPPGSPDPLGTNATEQARLDAVVTGTSTHCQGLVNQYNNDAQNYTKAPFRSHNLPYQEDPTLCEVAQ